MGVWKPVAGDSFTDEAQAFQLVNSSRIAERRDCRDSSESELLKGPGKQFAQHGAAEIAFTKGRDAEFAVTLGKAIVCHHGKQFPVVRHDGEPS